MKRIVAFLMAFGMVLSLAACGAPAQEPTPQEQLAVPNITGEAQEQAADPKPEAQEQTAPQEVPTELSGAVEGETTEKQPQSKPAQQETDTPKQEETAQPESAPIAPNGQYNEGVLLVKVKGNLNTADFGALAYTSAEPLYTGSKWYTVKLADAEKTAEAVTYLTGLGTFAGVDYDYVMSTGTMTDSVDVSCNPDYAKHEHHHTHKVPDGWKYATNNGQRPGGSSDVVIAVIDTGVDYTHQDLRNNIWVNPAEVAGNGLDDDGNGYIDDVYGWDCVGDDGDPMDDNGHGTHVAGIIGAENNELGGVGIAYNCKIMVLKAGNSSGYFNNSDIAEAIQYAYMNGASVINMSFGGSNISIAVEEALENAYHSCILVAAAGNDGACNYLSCRACETVGVSYPAALPYVIGVMSTNHDGSVVSSFSNYDHDPYNAVEYEVYAVGEAVPSCWPGNKYASLNGTSMAAPTVSGIAALLRSYYSDREVYSTKFIQSQIVNTGTQNPYNYVTMEADSAHCVTNVYEALTQLPKPEVNLYDYSIDDSTAISSFNNGNGAIDAGETVRLYISLHNRGGVASNVKVSIDTNRGEGLTDPYFTFVNTTVELSDIGTYSVRESGDKYFEIVVSADCPNDYLVDFNIRFTYTNGMDEQDKTVYEDDGKQKAQFNVSRGYHLPSRIDEDTVFTNDRLYIVGENVLIPKGITVVFEEGCHIQFYDGRAYYNSPVIINHGTLIFRGTKDNLVELYPSQQHYYFMYAIQNWGVVEVDYAKLTNCAFHDYGENAKRTISNSFLQTDGIQIYGAPNIAIYENGAEGSGYGSSLCATGLTTVDVAEYYNNYIHYTAYAWTVRGVLLDGNYFEISSDNSNDIECHMLINNVICTTPITGNPWNKTRIIIGYFSENGLAENNYIFTDSVDGLALIYNFSGMLYNPAEARNNTFSPLYRQYASQLMDNYYGEDGLPRVDVNGACSDISKLWTYVESIELFDKDGQPITIVGKEEIKVRVTFSRPVDTTRETTVTFGTIAPYADYRIDGQYVSDTVWEGTYTLKAQIENGQNYMKVNGAGMPGDPAKEVYGDNQLHEFTIDTTAAMAMNLQAVAKDEGIQLTFAQDDYDTLLGYNIYRSTEKDGNFVKLNRTILLPEENTFLDDNAEPGKTYWYTYTVVLSDFTESNPAGKVQATAKDTMAPSLYHTPVNQGYENNNLVISCTATDNVAIRTVTLFYRAVGAAQWKSLTMSKQNNKYSATIFGSDVTLAGLEYYIVASDGINEVMKGSAEAPYTVTVKAADSLLGKGDVDGNGSVTTKDALMLMQCLNGDLLLSDDAFKRADLNGDGILASAEALRILQYINGKVTNLDM